MCPMGRASHIPSRPARGGRIEIDRAGGQPPRLWRSRPARGGRIEIPEVDAAGTKRVVPPRTGRAD